MESEGKKKKQKKSDEPISVAKTPAELQKMRLDKLMKNPAKPVYIPEGSKAAKMKDAPEFVRNVWGSSAGAGSGDFHVYRGVRRREYARQKFNTEMYIKNAGEEEYHKRVEENKKAAEEKTAKKRAKRQKKKEKMKNKKAKKETTEEDKSDSESDDDEEEEEKNDKRKRNGKGLKQAAESSTDSSDAAKNDKVES